eukprot:g1605.t1
MPTAAASSKETLVGDEGVQAGAASDVAAAAIAVEGESFPATGEVAREPAAPMSGTVITEGAAPQRQIAVVKHKSKNTKEVSSPEPVYLQDIDFDFASAGGVATAADILVKQARNRVRVNRLKEGQAKGRHTGHDEKGDEKRLKLTIRMMLGVRVAVGRQCNPLDQPGEEIGEEAFAQVDKYTFPPAGATGRLATPSHKLNKTFKFRDYAPKAFKKLRHHFGIEESAYMLSVAGNYDYLELITNSKSGSFFFYSHDQKYIIKAMKSAEAKLFRKILPKYYAHHLAHSESLLIRFCGMYMVKNGHKKIPFIVMKCVEGDTNKKIHSKYDLKGSSLGRSAKEGEKVLKDNDLDVKYGKIHLASQKAAFIEAAKADAKFLCSVNVMDYSMLFCVHDTTKPAEEPAERRDSTEPRYSSFYTFADEASNRKTPEFERLSVSSDAAAESTSAAAATAAAAVAAAAAADAGADAARGAPADGAGPAAGREGDPSGQADVPSVAGVAAEGTGATAEGGSVLRYRSDGGVNSEVDGARGKDIYFMGIIDILQQYNTRKHAETFWKSLSHDRNLEKGLASVRRLNRIIISGSSSGTKKTSRDRGGGDVDDDSNNRLPTDGTVNGGRYRTGGRERSVRRAEEAGRPAVATEEGPTTAKRRPPAPAMEIGHGRMLSSLRRTPGCQSIPALATGVSDFSRPVTRSGRERLSHRAGGVPIDNAPAAPWEENAVEEVGVRQRSPSPEVQVLTKEEAARVWNSGGRGDRGSSSSGATPFAEHPAARPPVVAAAAGPRPAPRRDDERHNIGRVESSPTPSGPGGGGRLAAVDGICPYERKSHRQREARSGCETWSGVPSFPGGSNKLEEESGGDGAPERRLGGWRPASSGPRWRPVSWGEVDGRDQWLSVSPSKARERIKRVRQEDRGCGVPQRSWYGGGGGGGGGC